MYALQDARTDILKALKAAIGKGHSPTVDELETPRVREHGDVAFPCFGLAKGMKKAPNEIANDLAASIKAPESVDTIEANGPYVNFYLKTDWLAERVMEETSKKKYGHADTLSGKKIMVEYAQPNTHKPVHVGHLRNALFGQAIVNVLEANGANVIPTSYINDLGLHVAKCLFGIQKFHPDESPAVEERMAFLGKTYAEASTWLDEHESDKKEVQKIYQSLEQGERGWISLWKKTKGWSMDYIKSVFDEIGLTITQWYFESDLLTRTNKIVDELMEKGIAEKSDGAIIVNLEDQNLAVYLLVRSDGTLLYTAKDLGLAYKKEHDHSPDLSLYVVDVRQSLAFDQAFATLKMLGFEKNLKHLSYELLTLPEGKMASRTGNVISYDQLRDALLEASEEATHERHHDWDQKKIDQVSRNIAFAAMKFSILKTDPDKVITFNMKDTLSFDGFTGPYCLYMLARIESLFKKAGSSDGADPALLSHPLEASLLRKIADLPDVVQKVGQNYQVSAFAHYAFDLAKIFSEFYHEVPVLQAKKPELVAARLGLCRAVSVALTEALAMLNIDPVTEM